MPIDRPVEEPVDSPTSRKPARSGSKQQVDRLAHKTMTAIEKRDANRLAFARRVSCRTFSWRWPHVRVAQTSRYSSALNSPKLVVAAPSSIAGPI